MKVLLGARVEGAAMPMRRPEARVADVRAVARVEKRILKDGLVDVGVWQCVRSGEDVKIIVIWLCTQDGIRSVR